MLFFMLFVVCLVVVLILAAASKKYDTYSTGAFFLFIALFILCGCVIGMFCSQTPTMVRMKLESRQEQFETIQANIQIVNSADEFTDETAKAEILQLKAETNVLIENFNKSLLEDKRHNESLWIGWFVPDEIAAFDTFERLR